MNTHKLFTVFALQFLMLSIYGQEDTNKINNPQDINLNVKHVDDDEPIDEFVFGFEINLLPSWISSSSQDITTSDGEFGVSLGIIGEYQIHKNFAYAYGISYAFNQGGTITHDFGGDLLPNSELTRELNDVRENFPPGTMIPYKMGIFQIHNALKVSSNPRNNVEFFTEFPKIGLLFVTKARSDIDTGTEVYENQNILKDVNTFQVTYGASVGVGFFLANRTNLKLSLGYESNFGDLTRNSARWQVPNDDGGFDTEKDNSSVDFRRMAISFAITF